MSENKFIRHLQGKDTAKSVLEIKNQNTPTSFANMPTGTSNANDVYSDPRGDAVGVLKGSENWKIDGQNLVEATTVYGDGRDLTTTYQASGATLWVNSTYTFSSAKRFNPNTKFVLKLCGHSLDSGVDAVVDFSLIITFGNTIITKTFRESIYAFNFCKEFVIDFAESNASAIKIDANDTMQVQLLCSDATASATIYNGMTVFTALQRRIDAETVSSNTRTLDELEESFDDLSADFDQFVINTQTALDGKVNIDGSSIMTAPLKFAAGSMRGAVGPYLNGVSFWKMSSQHTITNIANLTDSQFLPVATNAIDLGRSANTWKDLYLGGKAYVATLNNGADLTVPNKTGTLATMGDVELAARSGRMLTDQGVWYAKMYSATVPPAADNGTNYADFSQVDGDNNPIIVIYERQSGAWVQTETITLPAEYDGYVPITSKIWDIAEQAGQQGGRVLWNHVSKEFTPYPTIISFEDIEITGTSTVIMPNNPSANQIVNKDYVDTLVSNSIGDATITLTQGGQTMGSFTTNQSGDATIALDGGSSYHPTLFAHEWDDKIRNDVQWLRADTFSWQSGTTYSQAFWELFYDIQISTYWYLGDVGPAYTKSRTPSVGDAVYLNSNLTGQIGTVAAYDDLNDAITVGAHTYTFMSNTFVTPTTETVAGYSLTVYTGHSGRKIVGQVDEYDVDSIYNATGVAWYYVIDINNNRFKLPRTKFAETGLRDTVGNYVEPGLPNITGDFGQNVNNNAATPTGCFATTDQSSRRRCVGENGAGYHMVMDASKSSAIYGNSTTVQPAATQMYLYFYVGEFTQTALENTAGITAETLNDKVDKGHQVIEFQAPTALNDYTWYRKYADGWVEQGGLLQHGTAATVTVDLPVEMADANYTWNVGFSYNNSNNTPYYMISIWDQGTTSFKMARGSTADKCWEVKGMAA